jgi:class 3 adenylate cyclase
VLILTGVLGALVVVLGFLLDRMRRAATILGNRVEASARQLEALQGAFSRFAPPEVVEDIIAHGVSNRSEKKEVTVLFADLKAFTPLAERLDPVALVGILNGHLERMSTAIRQHQGHVAKFIGDGILALFGALEANPWQTNDAAHAALAMRRVLAEYNAELARNRLPTLAVGIGIHRGTVVAGVMGSTELMEYGVIGSTVNVAARVEALTRHHEVDILVSEAARAALDPRFRMRELPSVEAKGVSVPLTTYALEGFET